MYCYLTSRQGLPETVHLLVFIWYCNQGRGNKTRLPFTLGSILSLFFFWIINFFLLVPTPPSSLSCPTFPAAKVDIMQMQANANVWRLAQATFAYSSTLTHWNRVTCWPRSGCQGNDPPSLNTHTSSLYCTQTEKHNRTDFSPRLQHCRSLLTHCTDSPI